MCEARIARAELDAGDVDLDGYEADRAADRAEAQWEQRS